MLKAGGLAAQSTINADMFTRLATVVYRHGRRVVEGIFKKGETVEKVPEVIRIEPQQPKSGTARSQPNQRCVDAPLTRGILSQYLGRNIKENLRKSELRKRFSYRLEGPSKSVGRAPYLYRGLARRLTSLAFVGVGLAGHQRHVSGNEGREHHDFDSVCQEIQEFIKRQPSAPTESAESCFQNDSLEHYDIGPMIGKGCDGVVFRARLRNASISCNETIDEESEVSDSEPSEESCDHSETTATDDDQSMMTDTSDIEIIDETSSFSGEDSDFVFLEEEEGGSDIEVIRENEDEGENAVVTSGDDECGIPVAMEIEVGTNLFDNSSAVRGIANGSVNLTPQPDCDYDLALKMMHNYSVQSNADSIGRAMSSELVPARSVAQNLLNLENYGHRCKMKAQRLPPHPNIVDMQGVFVDSTPYLPEGPEHYPDALPPRYNPDGAGRNMTLFLVMKRYPLTLRQYLETHTVSTHDALLLLTQLVEAVVHMTQHNIAHRDLKSNNIFITTEDGEPHLVVGDFGSCLVDSGSGTGLVLHYPYEGFDKGGNVRLMAPEIASVEPGRDAYLDYRKSDLWTVGTLAYEICGAPNPFYHGSDHQLNSNSYEESDLPALPDHVPDKVKGIVRMMLRKNPEQRPSAVTVANMLGALQWAPPSWLQFRQGSRAQPPSQVKVMRWLLTLFTEVICEKLGQRSQTVTPRQKTVFLQRLRFPHLNEAVQLLWNQP